MQTQFKKSVCDYLFYTSLIIMSIWLFLKVVGIINTPVWLEYRIPIGMFIFGFFTFYQSLIDKIFILSLNDAKLEEHILHIDKDIEFLKTALQK